MEENINLRSFFTPNISNMGGNLVSKTRGDRVIWAIVIILTLISLLVVYSSTGSLAYKYSKSTESYLFKQFAFIILGVFVIYFAHRVNYTIYSRIAKLLFLVSIPLLIYTYFFGTKLNEGSRWITLPVINMTMQTSDLAKLALFMYVSRQISKRQNTIKNFKQGFLPLIIPVGIVCALIAPANLSTALLLGASCLLLFFIGRANTKYLLITIGIACIPIIILIIAAVFRHNAAGDELTGSKKTSAGLFARADTWINRVEGFMYGSKQSIDDDAYQVTQAKIAIAKGGLVGVGPGNSTQRDFLPQAY